MVSRGDAAILVGGAAADVERAEHVLTHLGEVRYVGRLGSGASLKLVANSLLGAVAVTAAEVQVAGEASGLDRDAVFWVLSRLVPSLAIRRAGFVDRRHQPTLFATRDLRKDLDLALDLFHRSAAQVPVTALIRELVSEAAVDDPHLDITAVIERYRPQPAA
jgi:3-hydroxyisobutyrate dehydrogenase